MKIVVFIDGQLKHCIDIHNGMVPIKRLGRFLSPSNKHYPDIATTAFV